MCWVPVHISKDRTRPRCVDGAQITTIRTATTTTRNQLTDRPTNNQQFNTLLCIAMHMFPALAFSCSTPPRFRFRRHIIGASFALICLLDCLHGLVASMLRCWIGPLIDSWIAGLLPGSLDWVPRLICGLLLDGLLPPLLPRVLGAA